MEEVLKHAENIQNIGDLFKKKDVNKERGQNIRNTMIIEDDNEFKIANLQRDSPLG